MILRRLILPLVLVTGLGLVAAQGAQAAPVTALAPSPGPAMFGGIHVGIGVSIPVTRHRAPRAHRGHRVAPTGYYALRTERVWVNEQVVGYDAYGRAVVQRGHWATQQVRVWVPVHAPRRVLHRPRGRVHVGLHFR